MLINMGIALLCLYAVFMLASYSTPVPALCGTGAAFVHYFMLVYFMWTRVDAVILFIKLVIVFSSDIRHLALKLGLVAWREFRSYVYTSISCIDVWSFGYN